MVLQINGIVLDTVPDEAAEEDGDVLDAFFDSNPGLCTSNDKLCKRPHTKMGRDQVLFIRQRMQATSDYRENPKVRWIGK